jgi:hypothetical protein
MKQIARGTATSGVPWALDEDGTTHPLNFYRRNSLGIPLSVNVTEKERKEHIPNEARFIRDEAGPSFDMVNQKHVLNDAKSASRSVSKTNDPASGWKRPESMAPTWALGGGHELVITSPSAGRKVSFLITGPAYFDVNEAPASVSSLKRQVGASASDEPTHQGSSQAGAYMAPARPGTHQVGSALRNYPNSSELNRSYAHDDQEHADGHSAPLEYSLQERYLEQLDNKLQSVLASDDSLQATAPAPHPNQLSASRDQSRGGAKQVSVKYAPKNTSARGGSAQHADAPSVASQDARPPTQPRPGQVARVGGASSSREAPSARSAQGLGMQVAKDAMASRKSLCLPPAARTSTSRSPTCGSQPKSIMREAERAAQAGSERIQAVASQAQSRQDKIREWDDRRRTDLYGGAEAGREQALRSMKERKSAAERASAGGAREDSSSVDDEERRMIEAIRQLRTAPGVSHDDRCPSSPRPSAHVPTHGLPLHAHATLRACK